MKKHFVIAVRMTIATTILLGIVYPLIVTGLAQTLFRENANGQLIERRGVIVGSRLIGQPFLGPGYFHSRPSAAGETGYDATSSGGSNLGPTNQKLIDRVKGDVARLQSENPGAPIPVDLVTASGSGLDPHISLAAVEFQVARISRERRISEADLRALIEAHTSRPQLGLLGESRVNVLELNLALDDKSPRVPSSR
jgi:potassium-transporting ATPase KdpC subunit